MAQAAPHWSEPDRTVALPVLAGCLAMVLLLASCGKKSAESREVAPSDASIEDIEIERACRHHLELLLKCKGEIVGPIEPRIESCIEVTRRSRGGLSEIGRACSAAATCKELQDCYYWVHGGNRPEDWPAKLPSIRARWDAGIAEYQDAGVGVVFTRRLPSATDAAPGICSRLGLIERHFRENSGGLGLAEIRADRMVVGTYRVVLESDLNRDGLADRVLRPATGCSGSAPCKFDVMIDCGNGNHALVAGLGYAKAVEVDDPGAGGAWRDIWLFDDLSDLARTDCQIERRTRFRWTGTTYEPADSTTKNSCEGG